MNAPTQPTDALALLIEPIAKAAAEHAVQKMLAEMQRLPEGRLGFSEREAAELLGVPQHRLRDCRLRGEISARLVGKSYVYGRQTLLEFLSQNDNTPVSRGAAKSK